MLSGIGPTLHEPKFKLYRFYTKLGSLHQQILGLYATKYIISL